MTDDVAVERLPPTEAFELVAHEMRLGILRALNEAEEPPSFGELRQRVGVEDSGQFNYHLGKLDGRFVRQVEDGYWLTPAGERIVGAILSGGYTMAMDADPVPMGSTCNVCGGSLETRFREHRVVVTCTDCGYDVTTPEIPPGILEGADDERIPDVVDRWLKRKQISGAYGFCPNCDGPVDRTLALPGDDEAPDWFGGTLSPATLVTTCERCGHWWHAHIEYAAVTHPAVVAFHYEHGVDVRETPEWDLDWLEPGNATVESVTPLRVALDVTVDGETRTFVFDREMDLVEERDDR